MRKILCVSAMLLMALALASGPAVAGDKSDAVGLESLTKELERAFVALTGAHPEAQPVFRKHGGGVYSLTLPISEERAAELRTTAGRPLTTLAAGHMLSEPLSMSTPITAVRATVNFDYNLWWAAVNLTDDDLDRQTKTTVKGPSTNISDTVTLTYEAMALELFWFEVVDTFKKIGIHTRKTTITNAGSVKYKTWAE